MPVIIVTPLRWSRSPLQTFLLGLCLVTGIAIIFHKSDSRVINAMGYPESTLWGFALGLGSFISLLGAFWRNRITGMLIERAGIVLLGGASIIWTIMVLKVVGIDGLFPAVATAVFGATCFWQVGYINEHINLILSAIDDAGKSDG